MKLFSRGTITCPECGTDTTITLFLGFLAHFRCWRCGLKGFGYCVADDSKDDDTVTAHMDDEK